MFPLDVYSDVNTLDAQCIDYFQVFLPVHYCYYLPHRKGEDTLIIVVNNSSFECWTQSEAATLCDLKSEEVQWNRMQYMSMLKNLTLQVPVGLTT